MSAFMVSKVHIDHLVAAIFHGPENASHWDFRSTETEEDIGETLVKENLSSIHYRYPDTINNPEDTPGPLDNYFLKPYTFEQPARKLSAVQITKLIDCYEYQSCEHNEWERSEAHRLCAELRSRLSLYLPGYDEAAWDADELQEVA